MTNSCSQTHLSFNQSFERPATYGASARLAISPSQPGLARFVKPPLSVASPGFGELQGRARPECPRQSGATLFERPVGQAFPVDLQNIEDAVDHRVRCKLLRRGCGRAEALLQPAERCLVSVVRDHLTVKQELACALRDQGSAHFGIRAGEVFAGARLEPHITAPFTRNAALAVELALEQPVAIEIATVRQGRQHQRHRHSRIVPLLTHAG